MLNKKLIFPALISALLLTGCSAPAVQSSITLPEEPVTNDLPEITLTGEEMAQTAWYQELCGEILQYQTSCIVSDHVTNKDVKKALAQLPNDHPEIFWLGDHYSAVTVTDGSKVDLGLRQDVEKDNISAMYDELEAKAAEIIAGVPEGSTYDKVLYIHDYIANNCTYDHKGAASQSNGLWGTSYGCLVNGDAVCQGYAEAFNYLMNKLGIESGMCTGSDHAWNYVNIDGKYYWLDITWDDLDYPVGGDESKHCYFLVTSDMIFRTRTLDWTQGYFPECDSLDSNYFKKNGGWFDTYDRDAVISFIDSQDGASHCEFMFADYESYKEAVSDLFGSGKINKSSAINLQTMQYTRTDNMLSVYIEF